MVRVKVDPFFTIRKDIALFLGDRINSLVLLREGSGILIPVLLGLLPPRLQPVSVGTGIEALFKVVRLDKVGSRIRGNDPVQDHFRIDRVGKRKVVYTSDPKIGNWIIEESLVKDIVLDLIGVWSVGSLGNPSGANRRVSLTDDGNIKNGDLVELGVSPVN